MCQKINTIIDFFVINGEFQGEKSKGGGGEKGVKIGKPVEAGERGAGDGGSGGGSGGAGGGRGGRGFGGGGGTGGGKSVKSGTPRVFP